MEDDMFCQMFLYSLINFLCFILSTIFLTSLYNVKSQIILLQLEEEGLKDQKNSYENSYSAIATLFAFEFLGFLAFLIVMMYLVKQIKVNKVEILRSRNVQVIQNNDKNNIESPNGLSTDERVNKNNDFISPATVNIEGGESTIECTGKIFMIIFVYCQVLFIIQLIVLTAYFSKAKNLEIDFKNNSAYEENDGKYFTKIYRNLIIVGYIFFGIFMLMDLFVVVIKCGMQGETEEERKEEEAIRNKRYCDYCSKCVITACEKMATTFKNCIKTGDQIKEEIIVLQEKQKDLKKYIEQLKALNINLKNNTRVTKSDLEAAHLPTYEEQTKVITVQPI